MSRAKKNPDEERLAYSSDEVKSMLAELGRQKSSFGSSQSRFWVPFIAAYSGARLTEICQLHLDDVYQIDGVWVATDYFLSYIERNTMAMAGK